MLIHEYADGRLRLHAGRIARIEINAPERRNAITRAMWEGLPEICEQISSDAGISAVLLAA
jgi:enoyl-CoA hydratase/carnithine racemase